MLRYRVRRQAVLKDLAEESERVLRVIFPASFVHRLLGLLAEVPGLDRKASTANLAERIVALVEQEPPPAAEPDETAGDQEPDDDDEAGDQEPGEDDAAGDQEPGDDDAAGRKSQEARPRRTLPAAGLAVLVGLDARWTRRIDSPQYWSSRRRGPEWIEDRQRKGRVRVVRKDCWSRRCPSARSAQIIR